MSAEILAEVLAEALADSCAALSLVEPALREFSDALTLALKSLRLACDWETSEVEMLPSADRLFRLASEASASEAWLSADSERSLRLAIDFENSETDCSLRLAALESTADVC